MQGPFEALILQTNILDMVSHGTVFTYTVLVVLAFFSILSLAIAFSKWAAFSSAASQIRDSRAFSEIKLARNHGGGGGNFRPAPLVKMLKSMIYAEFRDS